MQIEGNALLPFTITTIHNRVLPVAVGVFSLCLEDDEYVALAQMNYFGGLQSSGYLSSFLASENGGCGGGGGGGVTQLLAGAGVTLSPPTGLGTVTVSAPGTPPPVTKITAGTNVTLSPPTGLGNVTVNAVVPPPPGSLLLYTVHVAKNGNDTGADGSILKPFLTVQAAMDYAYTTYVLPVTPQPSPPFLRPCVFVNAGTYDDGPLVLPPQICVMGEGFNHSRIAGAWTIDARWTSTGFGDDMRSSWIKVGLFGTIDIDFETVLSNEGKLYANGCRFADVVTINQKTTNPSSNSFNVQASEMLAAVNIGSIPTFLQNVTFFGTLTLNQLAGGGVDNAFTSLGGSYRDIVINATNAAAPVYDLAFSHNVQPASTLTLNGPYSTVKGTLGSFPLQSEIVLAGGASINQITRTNQLNWSGPTTDRPAAPYTGQQFFDTTIVPNRPIWWNGGLWVDATGVGV